MNPKKKKKRQETQVANKVMSFGQGFFIIIIIF